MKDHHPSFDLEELLPNSSRRTIDMAISIVGNNPNIFKKILDVAMLDRGQLTMRAARVVNFSAGQYPHLIEPYLTEIVQKLHTFRHDSLRREMTKTLAEYPGEFDDESLSILLETCFKWFMDPEEKIAIKAYALDILYNISKIYPDLKIELISAIEQQLPWSSPGMKSREIKMLGKLYRETNQQA
ncbi:MAG: hypothetical protein KQI35_00510 [Bacteroidetes bacterium]|nr:hypothetical protein [Bacteroidota bacterium]